MSLCRLFAAAIAGLCASGPPRAAAAAGASSLAAAATEDEALRLLTAADGEGLAVARAAAPSEVARLISLGWWSAARQLVLSFHEEGDAARTVELDSAVRKQVGVLRQQADDLLLALSPQESERIGVVRCAFQWAQNSTAVFLTVKFAHRWSSPGALKLQNQSLDVSPCCLNFTASGEHSQLRKRYALDLHFFKEVSPDAWSWQPASAGRLTVEIRKAEPAAWPRLLAGSTRPGNMGVWDSMNSKWQSELREFSKAVKRRGKEAGGKAAADMDAEAAEAEEEALHESLSDSCANNASSPFFRNRQIAALCESYWPPKLNGKQGRDAPWLVLFYSPTEMQCDSHSAKCTTHGDRWIAVGRKLPQVASHAKVGAVNCDLHAAFCKKQEVGHMPFVRRYKAGKRKVLYGGWDIDSLMDFLQG